MLSDSSRYCLHADTFPFAGNPRGSCNAIRWLAGIPTWTRPTCLAQQVVYLPFWTVPDMFFSFINPTNTFFQFC